MGGAGGFESLPGPLFLKGSGAMFDVIAVATYARSNKAGKRFWSRVVARCPDCGELGEVRREWLGDQVGWWW